ncbi:MAG: acyltransferase [Gammaproteobacteria bacterium]|nr:acyltransferase [Gammaproteobacteria bacterium]
MQWQRVGDKVPLKGNRFTVLLGRTVFRAMGFRLEGEFPNQSKLIVAVAPHRSNVDFVLAMAVVLGLGLRASFLAKQSLFKGPLRWLMYALGGIPVERSAPQGLVGQLVAQFNARTALVLGVTPEGTRTKVREWKKGFALIAQAANVPVLPAIIDYDTRIVRLAPLITNVANADDTLLHVQQAAAGVLPAQAR